MAQERSVIAMRRRIHASGLARPSATLERLAISLVSSIRHAATISWELPIPAVPSGDVFFMSEVALATRFRYVDEVLHARTIHDKSCHERYPEEKFSQLQRQGLWANSDGLQTLKSRIRASRLIPLHRK